MGFGVLFFGYFLLLNISDFFFTDLITGLLLMLASYKLGTVSREYKTAAFLLIPFSLLGLFELVIRISSLLGFNFAGDTLVGIIGTARYIFIAFIGYFILLGIERLAVEVELKNLGDRCRWLKYATVAVHMLLAILQIPELDKIIPAGENSVKAVAIIGVTVLITSFAITAISLLAIYGAYMHICMPEDLVPTEEKPSRFGFVNRFREYEARRQQEYADYKMSKMQKKSNKGRKKKK